MTGNIDKSVGGADERADERGQAEPLIGSFLATEKRGELRARAATIERNRRPAQFRPQPEPVALRMQSARVAERLSPKNCEDRLEISQTDSAPGRRANELKGVLKNQPAKIRRPLPSQFRGDENAPAFVLRGARARSAGAGETETERQPGGRSLPDRHSADPKSASTHQNPNAGAGEIQNDRRQLRRPGPPARAAIRFPAVSKIVLPTSQEHNRCDAEKDWPFDSDLGTDRSRADFSKKERRRAPSKKRCKAPPNEYRPLQRAEAGSGLSEVPFPGATT